MRAALESGKRERQVASNRCLKNIFWRSAQDWFLPLEREQNRNKNGFKTGRFRAKKQGFEPLSGQKQGKIGHLCLLVG
jgi:hypothetical protein